MSTLAALAMITGAAFAEDNPSKFYQQDAGQWTVEGLNDGNAPFCVASTFYDNGTFVSLFITSDNKVHLLVHDTEWNIADPVGSFKGYTATFTFFSSNTDPDRGVADYLLKDNQTILFTGISTEFLKSWIKYDVLTISMPGDITKLDVGLSGSKQVVVLLTECMIKIKDNKVSGQNL